MRADRLIAVLLFLQTREQVTATQVAAELEISERTARRDLEALSLAGVPVYSSAVGAAAGRWWVGRVPTWYLVAGTDDGVRTFRVGRVTSAVAGVPVRRPEGFDLATAWAEGVGVHRPVRPGAARCAGRRAGGALRARRLGRLANADEPVDRRR